MSGPLILKLGGELLETPEQRTQLAACVASLTSRRPVAIVHGGGRAIDAELDRRGIAPRKVDGLRVTDAPTLDVVVSVLGGSANTDLVSTLVASGVPAVGLTGVDAGLGRATRVAAHRSTTGSIVDLGLVGDPTDVDASLVELLLVHGYVPVIASLGIDVRATPSAPSVLNINADVIACRLAVALSGSDLVIAGTTPGVLDQSGEPIATLDSDGVDALIGRGTATAGMIAKLTACRAALLEGVSSVRIIDGRHLDQTHGIDDALGTTLVLALEAIRKQSA